MEATEVMQAYAAAWERGDPEAAFEWYADDVVTRLPGRSRESGVHRGKPAVIGAINALLDRTADHSVVVEVLQRLESPSCVALVVREVVERGDARLEFRRVNVYTVHNDRIVDMDIFEADQYEVDAFFG